MAFETKEVFYISMVFVFYSRPQPGTETFSPPIVIGRGNTRIPGDQLGCYFCSDVVAPTDVNK